MSTDNITALGEDFDANYECFIADAIHTGCVWGLEGPEGWALCPSVVNDKLDVLPLWSQPDYASVHCVDEWSHYQVVAIALDELLDDWLPGLHEDLTRVGINWNAAMEGDEMEPLDLLEDIDNTVAET